MMPATDLAAYLADPEAALPERLATDEAVAQIRALHDQSGGVTFSLHFGDLSGQSLFAVSLYPERSVLEPGRSPAPGILRRFLLKNQDLLRDPRNNIGLWYNPTIDATYLDISATFPDQGEAIELAERYNQEAIYDLAQDEVIDTGGTGEAISSDTALEDRLPLLSPRGGNDSD